MSYTEMDRISGVDDPLAQTMRAGVYRGSGQVAAEDVPVPKISEGEMLIRVAACGICGTDVKKVRHGLVRPPQILGHEIAGTIVAAGPGVRGWKIGDRVSSFHHIPCGTCFYCERRLYSQCSQYKKVGLTAGFDPNGGGFAQYVRVMPWIAERGIVRIPDDVSFEKTVPLALDIARPGGRVLLFAQNDPFMQIEFPAAAVGIEEKEILGSYSASIDWQMRSAELVFSKRDLLRELISHRFSLEAIGDAFRLASHPAEDSLKLVILP